MEEAAHIFDNLDTPSISPVTIDEELAPEFEPLAKGTRPVKTVQGNMVCADMRLVCAFDSDQVTQCVLSELERSRRHGGPYFAAAVDEGAGRGPSEPRSEEEHLLSVRRGS